MLKIASRILLPYDELLVKTAVPERSCFLYKKWLRYYLNEKGQSYLCPICKSSSRDPGLHGFYDLKFRICNEGFRSQQEK